MYKAWFVKRRAYFYVTFCALLFSVLGALKYGYFLSNNPSAFKVILQSAIGFIGFLIPGLLIARWYYKVKK
jgi:hypothetical protein